MKIYTSYFGNISKLSSEGIVPIAICAYPPKYFNGPNIKYVAPSKDILFNCKGNHELYTERYTNEILKSLTPAAIQLFLSQLEVYSNGHDVALCCYEKPNEFCHRHLLAAYLNEHYGLNIHEFTQLEQSLPLF